MDYKKLLDVASFDPVRMVHPPSWVGHMPFAYWLVGETRPNRIVELGVQSGNSYFTFCQSVEEHNLETQCFAVDTWKGDVHSGPYGADVFEGVAEHNNRYHPFSSSLLRSTFDNAVGYFKDGSIDILHIDGLHTYEAVKHDFETWQPKLSMNAVVLFHDTQVKHGDFGVWKFWEELKLRQSGYPNMEFLHCNGLGVISGWGYDFLFDPQIRKYFTALGLHQMDRYDLMRMRGVI